MLVNILCLLNCLLNYVVGDNFSRKCHYVGMRAIYWSARTSATRLTPAIPLKIILVKFRFSEKATKISHLFWCYWGNEVGDFFQTLWPSHNILTLKSWVLQFALLTWMMVKSNGIHIFFSNTMSPFRHTYQLFGLSDSVRKGSWLGQAS